MKFPILKEERLPGTIDRDRITIETPWEPMADRIPGHRKQFFLAIAFRQNRPMTLQAIGAQLGLTRERIRQIQASALRKLRHPRIKAIVGGSL